MSANYLRILLFGLLSFVLSGCQNVLPATVTIIPNEPAKPEWVRATGYAPISLQPGDTPEQKQLNAMRVSKLRAYQELAAIVNGQYLYGTTTVESRILNDYGFKAAVAGIVMGARVVKTYPVQDDTYATVLEVDLNRVEQAWSSAN